MLRIGIGTDTHAFSDSTGLRLGLLDWPNEPGLAGHSDGDTVAHALCDALLSAAGLGDLGSNFGTSDPAYAGAAGEVFLRETLKRVRAAGFEPLGASVQVVAAKPKIGPRRAEMEGALTTHLGFPVTVSATTTDGLGFTGEGKGITAVAVAHQTLDDGVEELEALPKDTPLAFLCHHGRRSSNTCGACATNPTLPATAAATAASTSASDSCAGKYVCKITISAASTATKSSRPAFSN